MLLVARNVEKLEETKAEIASAGGSAHIHRCDMADIEDIERMSEEVLAYHGDVDILVNNAGRSIRRSMALSYERFHDYERSIQLNYLGSVRLTSPCCRRWRRNGGHVIVISLDRRADQRTALLRLRRLQGRARRLQPGARLGDGRRQASTSRRSTCRWCARL